MDNLTHSLVGLVAGEAMARCTVADPRGLPAPARRNALIAISIIGSNLPDIDLAWSMRFVTGDRMGYLLHHRGHTHTLLGCLLLAALLVVGTWLWHRLRHRQTRQLDALAATSFPAWRTLDHVLAPAPANPLCWDVLLLQQSGDEYVVRRGQLAVLTRVSVDACTFLRQRDSESLFTRRVDAASSGAVRWNGEYVMSPAELVQLTGSSCTVRELMQFARVPFATRQGQGWVLGDLRFDNGRGGGMTEVTLTPGARELCRHDLPWVPPRADVLGLRSD